MVGVGRGRAAAHFAVTVSHRPLGKPGFTDRLIQERAAVAGRANSTSRREGWRLARASFPPESARFANLPEAGPSTEIKTIVTAELELPIIHRSPRRGARPRGGFSARKSSRTRLDIKARGGVNFYGVSASSVHFVSLIQRRVCG
jgi:hypothetical protein